MNRLEDLKVFSRIAELGSFTQAAVSLGLPKANVSVAIARLEADVGARLLQRTTRRVQLTAEGTQFYERCRDLLTDVDELGSMFRRKDHQVSGRVRIDLPVAIARELVIPNLAKFHALYPDIEVELGSSDRRVDLIREGFDCVLRAGNLSDSDLIAKSVGQLTIVNCASKAYVKKHGAPKTIADLSGHVLIRYASMLGGKAEDFEYFDGSAYQNVKMKGFLTVNNSDAYRAACLAGLGIVQAPLIGMQEGLARGELVEILPQYRAEAMPVALIYPHRRNLAQRVRVIMDWMEALLLDYLK